MNASSATAWGRLKKASQGSTNEGNRARLAAQSAPTAAITMDAVSQPRVGQRPSGEVRIVCAGNHRTSVQSANPVKTIAAKPRNSTLAGARKGAVLDWVPAGLGVFDSETRGVRRPAAASRTNRMPTARYMFDHPNH